MSPATLSGNPGQAPPTTDSLRHSLHTETSAGLTRDTAAEKPVALAPDSTMSKEKRLPGVAGSHTLCQKGGSAGAAASRENAMPTISSGLVTILRKSLAT